MKQLVKNISNIFRKPIDIRYSWINEPAKCKSLVDFLNWFDATSSVEETLKKAQKDWDERITKFGSYATMPKHSCIEIGFGGGRLVVPASKIFPEVIGIDIHSAFDRTSEFLHAQNIANFSLIHRDELNVIQADSIDFIFSFIVFQHFDSFEEIDYYIAHIRRVLKPNGYCHIFFGKCDKNRVEITSKKEFRKRACSLFVEPLYFRQYLIERGFAIEEYEDKMPKRLNEPLSERNESGQARILFLKKLH